MFRHETSQESLNQTISQDVSQVEIDMKELYKWLERPITEEDEDYRDLEFEN